ncbi:hypothetical protein Tco_0073316 [Tanacetum coccineum]
MIKDINKLLKERRMMRSLEKFVGGRLYENDLRLAAKNNMISHILFNTQRKSLGMIQKRSKSGVIGTNATDDGANIGNNPQQGVCYEVSVKQLKGLKMKRKTCKVGDGGTDISNIARKPSKTGKHEHGKQKSTREAKDSKPKPEKVKP